MKHFISKNYQNDISKWPDIKDDDQRCQVVRRYGVSKTSVLFRYQLILLCDVLSWSDSLKYQFIRRYTSQIGRFYLRTSETSQRCLKMVRRIDVPVATLRHNDVSAWFGTFTLVTKMGHSFAYYAVNFFGVSGGLVSLRYQLLRCYNVSKTSISFRYQL